MFKDIYQIGGQVSKVRAWTNPESSTHWNWWIKLEAGEILEAGQVEVPQTEVGPSVLSVSGGQKCSSTILYRKLDNIIVLDT